MGRSLLVLPALLLMQGCAALDPVEAYRAAARRLEFHLEAVRPRIDLQFPLDRSALVGGIDLGVRNPSPLRLGARGLGGRLHLDSEGASFPLGDLGFPGGFSLEGGSRRTLGAELRLPYRDLKAAWSLVQDAVLRDRPATWRLEGKANLDLLGVPFELPLKASTQTGSARR